MPGSVPHHRALGAGGAADPTAVGLGAVCVRPVLSLPLACMLLLNPSTTWTSCPAPGLPPSASAWPKLLSTAGCWALQGLCLISVMVGNMALLWQGLVTPAWGPSAHLPQCTYPTLDLASVGASPTSTLQPDLGAGQTPHPSQPLNPHCPVGGGCEHQPLHSVYPCVCWPRGIKELEYLRP